jgi:hypothetical protein
MNMHLNIGDVLQANLGFVTSQTAHIEAQVNRITYPDIQYSSLIPVDTSANPWATSVTYFSMDSAGKAQWTNGKASDVSTVGLSMDKFDTPVAMASIGYDMSIEEVNQARMMGISLGAEKAMAARRICEEFIDETALNGNAAKGFLGLWAYTGVPSAVVAADGTGSSPLWSTKTPALILRDVNDLITGTGTATAETAYADTLVLPFARFNSIASMQLPNTTMTVLEFLRQNNVYTARTGQPLTIRAARGLETKGAGSTMRMVAYRRSPDVLKLHLPMPHTFLPVQAVGLGFLVPGIFRLGGLDVRRPQEIRYADGV